MSPQLLVGLLALTLFTSTFADVKHVLDGSAHPPQCTCAEHQHHHYQTQQQQQQQQQNEFDGTFTGSFNPNENLNYNPNQAAPNEPNQVPGSVAFWWADANSPFKHAYEHFKKCSLKGNCLPPVPHNGPANPACGPGGCTVTSSIDINRSTESPGGLFGPVDVQKNPFLNGQIQGVAGQATASNQGNDGKIDISKNPFLAKPQNAFSGNGQTVSTGSDGFLGVQPAQPFGKPYPTTAPAQGFNQNFQQPSPQGSPGKPPGGQFQNCNQPGYVCVPGYLCANGLIKTDGEALLQERFTSEYCEAGKEVCCRLPEGVGSSYRPAADGQVHSGFASSSSSFSSSGFANLSHQITSGKSSVPGSQIKFGGRAGISPGIIQVLSSEETAPRPLILSAGESGSDRISGTSNKVVRDTTPNTIFSSTVDYSNDKLDQLSFQSTIRGPPYLPPVSFQVPSSPIPDLEVPVSTYVPPVPTTSRPLVTGTIKPGVSIISVHTQSPFRPSSPAPFVPSYSTPVPGYVPSSQPTRGPPPQSYTVPPITRPSTYVPPYPSKPYIPPSTPKRPYIPPSTPTRLYVPSSTPPPYVPPSTSYTPYVPTSTTRKPYYVPPSQPSPTPGYSYPTPTPPFEYPKQPSVTINRYTPQPSQPPTKYVPSSPTPGYNYPKPSPPFEYIRPSSTTERPKYDFNNGYKQPGSSTPSYSYSPPSTSFTYPLRVTPGPSTPGYSYSTPSTPFTYPPRVTPPRPTNNGYLPPEVNRIPDGSVTVPSYVLPSQKTELPHAGCAAALRCVQEQYCTAEGVISQTPVVLTNEQGLLRVPTTECSDTETGIIGKCCRDPTYVDPWPSANLINGVDDGQYREDPNLGQYFPDKQRLVRSESNGNRKNALSGQRLEDEYQEPQNFPPQPTCGLRDPNAPLRGPDPLNVAFAEIPWQAMILRDSNRSLLCGGAIVKPHVVLTAAHCLDGLPTSDLLIKGGEWKLGIDEEPLPFQIVKVAAVVRHPGYQRGYLQNDLALLVLEEKLRIAPNIAPICLGAPNRPPSGQCIVTGWGKRILQAHLRNAIMKSIDINILDSNQCSEVLSSRYQHVLQDYSPNVICGFSANDQCDVDYGSAMACTDGNGQYTLSGIFSWDTGCKDRSQIGGYIPPDVEWIEDISSQPLTHVKALDRQYRRNYQ